MYQHKIDQLRGMIAAENKSDKKYGANLKHWYGTTKPINHILHWN